MTRAIVDWPRYSVDQGGNVYGPKGRLATALRGGYPSVTLCAPGRRKSALVHLLVLEAFVGPRPDGNEACHCDGDRENSKLSNLRWASQTENMADRDLHGSTAKHERHGLAKLTMKKVREARDLRKVGVSTRKLAAMYGVSSSSMYSALIGETWV